MDTPRRCRALNSPHISRSHASPDARARDTTQALRAPKWLRNGTNAQSQSLKVRATRASPTRAFVGTLLAGKRPGAALRGATLAGPALRGDIRLDRWLAQVCVATTASPHAVPRPSSRQHRHPALSLSLAPPLSLSIPLSPPPIPNGKLVGHHAGHRALSKRRSRRGHPNYTTSCSSQTWRYATQAHTYNRQRWRNECWAAALTLGKHLPPARPKLLVLRITPDALAGAITPAQGCHRFSRSGHGTPSLRCKPRA